MLYAAPVGAGAMAYAPPLLERLVADPRFVAIKEGSWEVATYEQNLRLIHKLRPATRGELQALEQALRSAGAL